MDLGAMAMKVFCAFPKDPALLDPPHQIVSVISRTLACWESYLSIEMQSVYSAAQADWATIYIYIDIDIDIFKKKQKPVTLGL